MGADRGWELGDGFAEKGLQVCELVNGLAMVWACLELFWFLVLRPWLWLKEMVL